MKGIREKIDKFGNPDANEREKPSTQTVLQDPEHEQGGGEHQITSNPPKSVIKGWFRKQSTSDVIFESLESPNKDNLPQRAGGVLPSKVPLHPYAAPNQDPFQPGST